MDGKQSGRELLGSRLGFILMAAGCAIGLGNIWRFPFIAGQNGGGLFVLLYLIFLAILGFPVLLVELAIGRAGRNTLPGALRSLQNRNVKFNWGIPGYVLFSGNMILLMFYSVVTGWMLAYSCFSFDAAFCGLDPAGFGRFFDGFLGNPLLQILFMAIAVEITSWVCMGGVRKVVEKVIKVMMLGLFVLLIVLVIRAVTLPGGEKGLSFFLKPDPEHFIHGAGKGGFFVTVQAAMSHAFFTLSLGIGSIAVCGSYTSKERSLPQEGLMIILLDTAVAICAGLVIFPACSAFGIEPAAGPSLVFITLPNVFQQMPGGVPWRIVFFIFMSAAALSTLIAVFENLVAFGIDRFGWTRMKSCSVFQIAVMLLSIPCILGFNLWQGWEPLGKGTCVLDLEDFIVSDNLVVLGSLYMTVFCTWKAGWGEEGFLAEVNAGSGLKLSRAFVPYLRWGVPLIIFGIWLIGILGRFGVIPRI